MNDIRMAGRDGNSTTGTLSSTPPEIPRRDFILLPLISLLTVVILFSVAEGLTRWIWPEQKFIPCEIDDAVNGTRFRPNCSARVKNAEGPWTTYQYNDCGYRGKTSCATKAAGTARIAIVGSSVAQGLYVPYEQTYFGRLANDLGRVCGRAVDVQNLGVPNVSPIDTYRRIPEVIGLKPDVVLYLVAPFDLEKQIDPTTLAERDAPARTSAAPAATLALSPMKRFEQEVIKGRSVLVAEHFLFENKETFLRAYLLYGDKADFLRQPFTAAWEKRFADMDLLIGGMADKLRTAGVPLLVVAVPSRAESALLGSHQLPANVDPLAFGRAIAAIAAKHGAGYVDVIGAFSEIPDAQNMYYVVDGHVAAAGQAVMAQAIVRRLEDGTIPAFSSCNPHENAERRN
ncbi:MAG TPA: SGNH/GDSL hydrolase family protein [Candidatus Acidoferrales bacterium]